MDALQTVENVFCKDGALDQVLPDFVERQQQREMALALEEALTKKETLLCEAGTGTGKTFAYLVPAILSDQTVIISTGTKHLQDQLYLRESLY